MRRLSSTLVMPIVVLAIVGCGSGAASKSSTAATTSGTTAPAASTPSTASVQISTRTLPGLGTVLVNGQGHTLYIFIPDKRKQVTCLSTCAELWLPFKLASGQKPVVSGQAKRSLLGSDPDPEGGQVATYAGWPLYTYISDSAPGSANGQALNSSGGLWYVLSPSGETITKIP